jgi:hypothetical protein
MCRVGHTSKTDIDDCGRPTMAHPRLLASVVRAKRVESRRGAVAWAMRQRSVSSPRSSNRTSGFPFIRLSDKTSSLRSRETMSFRLQFYESKRVVEVLVREACCSRAINLVLLT